MPEDILRVKLQDALKEKYPDYLSIQEVEEICRTVGRKLSNGERRFRFDNRYPHLYIPHDKVWNDNRKAIIGYRWVPRKVEHQEVEIRPKQEQLFAPGRVIRN